MNGSELLLSVLGGATGAALVTGIISLVMYKVKRRDEKRDEHEDEIDTVSIALRYIMLYIIQERAKTLISAHEVTLDEKRSLRQWHDLYHNGLHGNGDADELMKAVDALPIKVN